MSRGGDESRGELTASKCANPAGINARHNNTRSGCSRRSCCRGSVGGRVSLSVLSIRGIGLWGSWRGGVGIGSGDGIGGGGCLGNRDVV